MDTRETAYVTQNIFSLVNEVYIAERDQAVQFPIKNERVIEWQNDDE